MSIQKLIIVVEDEPALREFLKAMLCDAGYSVRTAADGIAAIEEIKNHQPDLVILDLGLPVMRGEVVCRESKKMFPNIPIIILTAQDTTTDMVRSFDLGADDYIAKPFDTEELMARVRARLREIEGDNFPQVADLILDTKTFQITRNGKTTSLTPQEYKFLKYLMENKGRVLTRDMILNRVWLYSPDANTRTVDVYVGYLRKKVDEGYDKKLIHSVRGFGYMLSDQ